MRKKIVVLLIAILVVSVGFLSGCNEETETKKDDELDDLTGDENTNDGEDEQIEDNKEDFETWYLSLGEELSLSDGGAITVEDVKTLVDYVTVSSSGYVYTYIPDNSNYGYLWIHLVCSNEGEDLIDSVSDYYMKLLVSGIEMEKDTPSYSISNLYESRKIYPDSTNEGWIIYAVPKDSKDIKFVLELSNGNAIWEIGNSEINFQERNLDNLADGESINFGSDENYYEMSISHRKTVDSYSYRSSYGDYIYTEEADVGYKFVFIDVHAENKGSDKIDVPSPYDMKLIGGGKQYSKAGYYGENSYQDTCGIIHPGITAEGAVVFEVPDSLSHAEIIVELTDEYDASWSINI